MPNTVKLHRVLITTTEKLYRAFLEPDAIPVEMCYLGCQESLLLLAKLVEPDIKG